MILPNHTCPRVHTFWSFYDIHELGDSDNPPQQTEPSRACNGQPPQQQVDEYGDS